MSVSVDSPSHLSKLGLSIRVGCFIPITSRDLHVSVYTAYHQQLFELKERCGGNNIHIHVLIRFSIRSSVTISGRYITGSQN